MTTDHLRGWEEPPSNRVGCWGGGRGEEEWRRDGTGAPEGRLGEGRGSHSWRGPLMVRGATGDAERPSGDWRISASISPAHLGSREPSEVPGLILCPLRPPPATWVLREWGRGRKSRGQMGPVPLREAGGGERFPCLGGAHHSKGISRDRERPSGDQRMGRELGQHFPCPLRPPVAC